MLQGAYRHRAGDTANTGNYILAEPVNKEDDRLGTVVKIDTVHRVNMSTKAMGGVSEIHTSPTGNCQIQSISNFYIMLKNYNNADCLHLLAQGWRGSERKTQLLIDIPENFSNRVEEMFQRKEIIFKKAYKNNTGTKMKMYLVQMRKMLERNNLVS